MFSQIICEKAKSVRIRESKIYFYTNNHLYFYRSDIALLVTNNEI
jgi:hypothetical protein